MGGEKEKKKKKRQLRKKGAFREETSCGKTKGDVCFLHRNASRGKGGKKKKRGKRGKAGRRLETGVN